MVKKIQPYSGLLAKNCQFYNALLLNSPPWTRKRLKSPKRCLKSAKSTNSNNNDILNDQDLTLRENSENRLFALVTFWTLAILTFCTASTIPIYKTYSLTGQTIVLDFLPEIKKGNWCTIICKYLEVTEYKNNSITE